MLIITISLGDFTTKLCATDTRCVLWINNKWTKINVTLMKYHQWSNELICFSDLQDIPEETEIGVEIRLPKMSAC